MPWFYYVGRTLTKILLFILTRWRVRGKENVPAKGAVLVVANHLSNVDPPLLAVSLGRKTIFMAKEELFRSRFSSYFVRSFGAFPVRRGQPDRKALHQSAQALADGLALIMFPEGARSKSCQLQPALPGSVLIALRHNVPVLPVGITGTEKIKGVNWLWRRVKVTVNIGTPFYLSCSSPRASKAEISELASSMMRRIAELLPPEYQGSYAGQKIDGANS